MAASSPKKKARRTVTDGIAHIHASFNNTIVMITDRQVGQVFVVREKAHLMLHR